MPRLTRDYNQEKPVTDEVFAAYRGLFSYDKTDLAAKVESSEESESWRVERVTYAAAYGGERIPAYLYLPKNADPPYQTVVYFPHSGGTMVSSFQQGEMAYLAFLIKAGRALLFPMYQGMYDTAAAEATSRTQCHTGSGDSAGQRSPPIARLLADAP